MIRSIWMALAGVAVLVAPAVGDAQERDWFAYRDSLRAVTEVLPLQRLVTRLPMPGLARSPEELIERGLIRLRIWEITRDAVDAEQAKDAFAAGAERYGGVAWIQYGLGLSYAAQAEAQLTSPDGITVGQSLAEILRRDPRSRGRSAARRALEIDPSFGPAAVLFAQIALEDGRNRDALLEAKRLLEALPPTQPHSGDVARALGDVETALGNYAEAEAALSAADAGDASAVHAQAVSLLLQGGREMEGTAAYFAAVDRMDEAGSVRMYRDVEPIVNDAEAAEWRAAGNVEARRQWLRRFWSRRAAEAGVTEAERLSEYMRRLAFARREYLRNSRRGLDGNGVLLSESWSGTSAYDDRGLILLRRGQPARVVTTRSDGLFPNETWVYPDADGSGNVLFHFVALRGSRDYNLVSDLLQALDPTVDPLVDKARFDRAVLTLIEDRAPFEPRYQGIAGRLRSELTRVVDRLAANGRPIDSTEIRAMIRSLVDGVDADYRRAARLALANDVHVAHFDHALPFHFDLFTMRAPFGRTDLTAAIAAPSQGLAAEESDGRRVYPLALSIILMDTLSDAVTRRDTVVRVVPDDRDMLRAHVTFPVVPSPDNEYRIVLRSPAIDAGALRTGAADLKNYGGLGLQVSDLVLAAPDSAGDWRRGDMRLALTLPRRFIPGAPFTLFYEVYNVAAETPYRTHVTVDPIGGGGAFGAIKRLFGGGPPHVDLRFEDLAKPVTDDVLQEIRRLGTDLPPGRYRMRVEVTNVASGERAESETVFEVIG